MKILVGLIAVLAFGLSAQAQEAKVLAELSASTEKIVKGSPFSAEAVSESVQTLADGNRIVRSSTSKLYRNGEGRFRREIANGSGGIFGSYYTLGPGVTIIDPVVGFRYQLDTNTKVAQAMAVKPLTEIKLAPMAKMAEGSGRIIDVDKLRQEKGLLTIKEPGAAGGTGVGGTFDSAAAQELRAKLAAETPVIAAQRAAMVADATAARAALPMSVYTPLAGPKNEVRAEDLGTQNIEGVEATGTRTITTIPAGAIGNERPIEIVYERWYSKELQLIVMSKQSDPRTGEQTYRLTNIQRSEPDPALFSVPTGYKVVSQGQMYRPATVSGKAEIERTTTTRAGQATTTYVRNKP
jgi:hypothetical protein